MNHSKIKFQSNLNCESLVKLVLDFELAFKLDMGQHWREGNGLLPDCFKPLPEPMLTY